MKFCWSTLMVNNLDESLTFYQDILGLNVNRRFIAGPCVEIAFLGDGDTKIELICDKSIKKVNLGQDISLGFIVSSVNETLNFIKEKGIDIKGEIIQPNPHIKYFYILDPNGLKIQLVENI